MRTTETWTYAGVYPGDKSAKVMLWLDPDGIERAYKYRAGYLVTGGLYEREVERDGDTVEVYGTGTYLGMNPDRELVARLQADDATAKALIARAALQRSDAKKSELDDILEPLLDIAAGYVDPARRDALAMYVARKIYTARRKT